jgi:hypothetical protein
MSTNETRTWEGWSDAEGRLYVNHLNDARVKLRRVKVREVSESEPDYRELFRKYIAYIVDCEGCDYIYPINLVDQSSVEFSADEWRAIEELSGYWRTKETLEP